MTLGGEVGLGKKLWAGLNVDVFELFSAKLVCVLSSSL